MIRPARGLRSAVASLTLCVLLPGCASTALPPNLFADATAAIALAEEGGAVENAPIELRLARERLAGARLAVEQRDTEQAIRLAAQAEVNAELALAKAAAARAREEAREQEAANRALAEDLGRNAGGRDDR